MLESGRMAPGCGSDLSTPGTAAVEAHRLRRVNEELQALLRLEEAFQRRQAACLRDVDRIVKEIRAGRR